MNLFILFLSQSFLSFLYFVFSLFFFMVVQPRSWSSHEFMVPFWWNPHILISSTILDQKEPGLSGGVDFVFGQKQKTRVEIRCHRDHQGHLEMWKESQGEGAKIVTSIKKKTMITVTGIDWVGARPWVQDDVQKVQITDSMPKINHVPSLSQLIGAWFAAWTTGKWVCDCGTWTNLRIRASWRKKFMGQTAENWGEVIILSTDSIFFPKMKLGPCC